MKVNLLAIIGVVVGLILIRGGLDSLLQWRASFLLVSGLVLFAAGGLGLILRINRYWGKSTGRTE